MATEHDLVRSMIRKVLAVWPGAWTFKVVGSPYQRAGMPDLLVMVEGVVVGLEAKMPRPSERPQHARRRASNLQRNQLRALVAAGGYGAVVLTPDEAVQVVRRALRERGRLAASTTDESN